MESHSNTSGKTRWEISVWYARTWRNSNEKTGTSFNAMNHYALWVILLHSPHPLTIPLDLSPGDHHSKCAIFGNLSAPVECPRTQDPEKRDPPTCSRMSVVRYAICIWLNPNSQPASLICQPTVYQTHEWYAMFVLWRRGASRSKCSFSQTDEIKTKAEHD